MSSDSVRRAEGLKEFCRSLGVSYDSGRRAMDSGKLKTIRFGHRILVPVDASAERSPDGLQSIALT